MAGKICCIVGLAEVSDPLYEKIFGIFQSIIEAVSCYLKFNITIGVGSPYEGIRNIYTSYNEAIHAVKSKIVLGYAKVIEYTETKEVNISENIFTTEQRNRILISMKAGMQEDVLEVIGAVFLKLKESHANVMLSYFKCIEMVSICIEYMSENNLDFFKCLNIEGNIIDNIECKKTIFELKKYVEEIFISAINIVAESKASNKLNLAQKVKTYIDQNITDCDLGIDRIANEFYVNYSYLCRTFKKEIGVTINEYITEARMVKAKELMNSGFHIVQFVSEKAGYNDPNYFSKCFRKYFGITPHKYIEIISEKL
jgi:two-component system response regulator YesN